MSSLQELRNDLKAIANPQKAKLLQGFFKTGKGEYGKGDLFLGIMVPQSRKIAIRHRDLSFVGIEELLHSKFHEERLIALFILVYNFEKGDESIKKKIYDFYLSNTKYINNWDLVDLSAPKIVGKYLFDGGPVKSNILINLVKSNNLWERRIAVLATFKFIKEKQFDDSLEIAQILLSDWHDLIHKAVGWMLREIGKRDLKIEVEFLNKYYKKMPRTMLRYAIEKFPEKLRMNYLKKN